MLHSKRMLNLLLADDDEDYHELFRQVLDDLNEKRVALTSVLNGEELIYVLEAPDIEPPDLIFLDINMPRKTGKESLRHIREHSRFDTIPIIMFTASSYYKDIEETHQLNANLYVTKSVFFKNPAGVLNKIFEIDWKDHFPKPDIKKYVLVN